MDPPPVVAGIRFTFWSLKSKTQRSFLIKPLCTLWFNVTPSSLTKHQTLEKWRVSKRKEESVKSICTLRFQSVRQTPAAPGGLPSWKSTFLPSSVVESREQGSSSSCGHRWLIIYEAIEGNIFGHERLEKTSIIQADECNSVVGILVFETLLTQKLIRHLQSRMSGW